MVSDITIAMYLMHQLWRLQGLKSQNTALSILSFKLDMLDIYLNCLGNINITSHIIRRLLVSSPPPSFLAGKLKGMS